MRLKSGDMLTWREPEEEEGWYMLLYNLWREKHGEEVEFVAYADEHDLHRRDTDGLPILKVRTRAGLVTFSAGYFIC
ncbi:hypothetical protein KW784_00380 [Candidatus Parcubacteria bacterium]|nr:hypothetical protein [Candidatus Parcubacteria bacterium]